MQEPESTSATSRLPLWKRTIDIGCCVLAMPLFAICTLVASILMRLTSPGPILFRQERVGFRGERFRLFKFRTMHVGANTASHQAHFSGLLKSNVPMQKLDAPGDSRLVKGAWLLRASGLDELPQIINVLRGEMSIVGPRPCIPYEYDEYTPEQRRRLGCVPGLTGLWQVSGKNRLTFEEMVELDVRYAEKFSLALDLKIMLLTFPVLVLQVMESASGRASLTTTRTPVSSVSNGLPGLPAGELPKREREFQRL